MINLSSIFVLLGSLAMFMYGMKIMSEGLQKVAGPQLRHALGAMTTNRFTGLLTGAFVTAAIQSSTATTVMTVSFVSAGLLSLTQAISVVMGANIGTTMTAWIMSAGFGFDMRSVIYPAFLLGIILIFSKKSGRKNAGELVFGISFLLLGLTTLKENAEAMDLGSNASVLAFFQSLGGYGFSSYLIFLFLGGLLTFCVQSSAAIMAITMILCSTGALPLDQGIALVMGENIGTTITSNIAALTGTRQARCAAMAHLVFNVFGVIWVLCVFKPFVKMVCGFVDMDFDHPEAAMLPVCLAAFHTSFNVCNVCVLIGFVRPLAKLVTSIVNFLSSKAPTSEEEDFRLHFISGGILSTAEMSIIEAHKEINLFAERTNRMFSMVRQLIDTGDDAAFNALYSRIEKYEGISDNMELEIAKYLNEVSDGRLSSETKNKIRAMLREVSEIESIGDSCYNLARCISHKRQAKQKFTEEQRKHLMHMFDLSAQALTLMLKILNSGNHTDAMAGFNLEVEINNYRKDLKINNVNDVANGLYSYQSGVFYMDMVNECEKMSDYAVNIIEARTGLKEPKEF